jgi:hypothetical protein
MPIRQSVLHCRHTGLLGAPLLLRLLPALLLLRLLPAPLLLPALLLLPAPLLRLLHPLRLLQALRLLHALHALQAPQTPDALHTKNASHAVQPQANPKTKKCMTSLITFLQHNCARRDVVHHTVLQQAFESNTTVLLLQEPHFPHITQPDGTTGFIALHHPAYHTVLPCDLQGTIVATRPRVMAYVRKNTIDFSPSPPYDLDLQLIRVSTAEPFIVVNLYNERREGTYTDQRLLPALQLDLPAVIVGDFNRHHYWWNPTVADSTRLQQSTLLVQWLQGIGATLLVDPEEAALGTFHRSNLQGTSIIDLAFYTTFRHYHWSNWHIAEHSGSDHEVIGFTAAYSGPSSPAATALPSYHLAKADWTAFTEELQRAEPLLQQQLHTAKANSDFDEFGRLFTSAITTASNRAIPRKKPCMHSKPWWNPDLKQHRTAVNTLYRAYRKAGTTEAYEQWHSA